MRTAIVGATGNVGTGVTALLSRDPGSEVLAVSRRHPESLPEGVRWRHADLGGPLPPDLLDGVDVVVHLAWLFQPSHAPATTWNTNVEGTSRLLRAVAESGVRTFVHSSSVGAYSPRQHLEPVDESWPTHGIATAAYSVEKAYVERLLDRFETDHPEVRVVRMRPAFIFQSQASVQQRRLFLGPLAPAGLVARAGLPLLPDPGGLVLQAVHTDDVAEAFRRAVASDVAGAFNLAADPVLTMADIAAQLGARVVRVPARPIRGLLGAAWGLRLVPASPGMFDLVRKMPVLDSGRARTELGWNPAHDAHQAVAALLDGLRSGVGGPTPPLAPRTGGALRSHEVATGVGGRSDVEQP